ncbi:MAG: hypothetical protein J5531_05745 [Lachnospiraceae bacterium]|nr:hypothetical protein [Lachnospiraceae bacterium]
MKLIDYAARETWNSIIIIGIMAVMILGATRLRRTKFFHKSLLPTAVLGGFLLLAVKLIGVEAGLFHPESDAYQGLNRFLQVLTYHGIAVGFIAMSLRKPADTAKYQTDRLTGPKSGAIIVSSYMIQGMVGLLISIGLSYTFMPDLFKASGLLLPMGYGQGPGQANNFGSTFEKMGFAGGHSFGLAIAAAGYISACVVGVLYLNYLARKGKISRENYVPVAGSVTVDDPNVASEHSMSESLDRLSLQMAVVIGVYLLTYVITLGLTTAFSAISEGLANTVNSLLWGFNFMVGSALAIGVRAFVARRMKDKEQPYKAQDNYLLSRISGLAFDAMIVAGIGSIELEELSGLWVPFVLMAVAGAVVTLLHLRFVCKRVYEGYYYEGMLSMYGMMTGTISSGVLLLREIDPRLKTPAANNLITGSSFAILLGVVLLVFVGMAPKSVFMTFLTFGLILVYYLILVFFIVRKPRKEKS